MQTFTSTSTAAPSACPSADSGATLKANLITITNALNKAVSYLPLAEGAIAALGGEYSSTLALLHQAVANNPFALFSAPAITPNNSSLNALSKTISTLCLSLRQVQDVCNELTAAHPAAGGTNAQATNTGAKPASAHQKAVDVREQQVESDAQVAAAIAALDKAAAESAADAQPSTSTLGSLELRVQFLQEKISAMEAAKVEADIIMAEAVGAKQDALDRLALASASTAGVSCTNGSWCGGFEQHLALAHTPQKCG